MFCIGASSVLLALVKLFVKKKPISNNILLLIFADPEWAGHSGETEG